MLDIFTWINPTCCNEASCICQSRQERWWSHRNDIPDNDGKVTREGEEAALAGFVGEVSHQNTGDSSSGIYGDCEKLSNGSRVTKDFDNGWKEQ